MRLPLLPWMTKPETRRVMDALNGGADMARFVGGCVRSAVLSRPIDDVDIATRHRPERVREILEAAGIKVVPTGLEHGTVTAVADGHPFEITTLRLDVETDGRRAVVAFTEDWREDAARRDFTMNAMFLRPDGTLDDPFGGYADALAGRVRFVGDPSTRIREDVLRILRFFRFHAHFGHAPIDPVGLAACRRHAALVVGLSGERVRKELLKLLAAPEPERTLDAMEGADVLARLIAGPLHVERLAPLRTVEARVPDPLLRLAALAPDAPAEIGERLRLSNAEKARLLLLCTGTVALDGGVQAHRRDIYRLGAAAFADLARLAFASGRLDLERAKDMLTCAERWSPPRFPLRGRDLVAFGLPAGEAVGEVLAAVERWWIEGDFAADAAACREKARDEIERRMVA